jgi:hypothetical protein
MPSQSTAIGVNGSCLMSLDFDRGKLESEIFRARRNSVWKQDLITWVHKEFNHDARSAPS